MIQESFSSSSFPNLENQPSEASFTEVSLLYTGAYCHLYKAKRYGQWFVLKCLQENFASQSLYQELLKKEFEIGISLAHPNIVRTLGWEKIEPMGNCIVMEYIDGVTFRQFLEKKHSASEKKRVIKGVLSALSYIHGKQIAHRDLKLSNILVTRNGMNAKLIDFGLSDTDSYSILKHPAGTQGYISPEQLSVPLPDAKNDIYSLGIILKKAHINLFYNYLAWKCTRKGAARFSSVRKISASIRRQERFGLIFPSILLLVLSGFLVLHYENRIDQNIQEIQKIKDEQEKKDYCNQQKINAEQKKKNYCNQIIEQGIAEIDRLYQPFIESNLAHPSPSYEEAAILAKMTKDNHERMLAVIDSLTISLDSIDKANVSNALNQHLANKTTKLYIQEIQKIKAEQGKKDYCNQIIEQGIAEVDRIYQPFIEFNLAHPSLTYEEAITLGKITKETQERMLAIIDSLTISLDPMEKANVSNALNLHLADKITRLYKQLDSIKNAVR